MVFLVFIFITELGELKCLLKKNIYFYFMSINIFASMYVCEVLALGTYGGQKRMLDPLKLEFQRALACHVGTGHQA